MTIDAKSSTYYYQTELHHILKGLYHVHVGFIPRMQRLFNIKTSFCVKHHINNMKGKKHDHINGCRKTIDKI